MAKDNNEKESTASKVAKTATKKVKQVIITKIKSIIISIIMSNLPIILGACLIVVILGLFNGVIKTAGDFFDDLFSFSVTTYAEDGTPIEDDGVMHTVEIVPEGDGYAYKIKDDAIDIIYDKMNEGMKKAVDGDIDETDQKDEDDEEQVQIDETIDEMDEEDLEDLEEIKKDAGINITQKDPSKITLADMGIDKPLLKTMIEANLKTMLPKIGDDGYQGAIQLERYDYNYVASEDEEEREKEKENAKMEYVSPEKFLSYLNGAKKATSYTSNSNYGITFDTTPTTTKEIDESKYPDLQKVLDNEKKIEANLNTYKKYYTLGKLTEENGEEKIEEDLTNIMCITYEKKVEINVETKREYTLLGDYKDTTITESRKVTYTPHEEYISYQDMVSQYNMAWDYLLALAEVSYSPDWVTEVANLAINDSYIELAIHDNYSENANRTINYKETKKKVGENSYVSIYTKKIDEIIQGTHTCTPQVERVYTWLYNKDIDYKNTEKDSNPDNEVDSSPTETETRTDTFTKVEKYSNTHSYTMEESFEENKKETLQSKLDEKNLDVNQNGEWIDYHPFLRLWKNSTGTVEIQTTTNSKGEEVPINDIFEPNGKLVKYKVIDVGKIAVDQSIIDACENDGILLYMLGNNASTQNYETIMRYLMNIYTGKESYGVTDPNELIKLFQPKVKMNTVGGDYIVKTDEPNAAPTATKEQLENGIKQWVSGGAQANALSVLDDVLKCEEKYKVNAVFMYALLRQETTIGTANTTWVAENNWTSLTGLGHIQYATPGANIEKMADIIANGKYYYTQGLYSVYSIGERYCADPPPPAWADGVSAYMTDLYNCMGVDISSYLYSDSGEITEMQAKIVELAKSGNSFGAGTNQCQKWVRLVYKNAVGKDIGVCCAGKAGDQWIVDTNKKNIPLGATVYGYSNPYVSCYTGGKHDAGHVGIYIGNGQVAHNAGGSIKTQSLDSWAKSFKWRGWGWQGGTAYGTATSSSSSFLEVAKKCHTILANNKWTYVYGAKGTANKTYEQVSKIKGGSLDCSAFVSWVLYNYNPSKYSEYKSGKGSEGIYNDAKAGKYGWKIIAYSERKAGDLLVIPNEHVEICAGGGKVYNCGSTNSVQSVNPTGETNGSRAYVVRIN